MIPKNIKIASGALLASCSLVFGTVTLQFSTFTGQADGFGNASGVTTNGMSFGVVVDTSGGTTGFSGLNSLNSFDITTDRSIISPDLVYTFGGGGTPPVTADFFGAAGSVTTLTGVDYTGFSASDPFAIIWFADNAANAGNDYGYLTDAGFALPADGNTGDFSGLAVFSGTGNFDATHSIVPEPSTYAALAGLCALGAVMVRRRRS
ncbi:MULTISPECIES: PEP-CTERM sorting domain-containing protein [unclassified Lentimonas]|uniref:PEP-CTERM sorting domain-containing protein n=1 Tax=unclassified Lentimonas TaxID=2630993 RepID=UPI001327236E|nr:MULTISPECIES: PEP-CTERM sorting domain-containing protein [unclassified Lentimonas]CAA6694085.1 Unannotated [Lentimonas sp. CC19]CAA6694411.1 Unannotated [Lentimonas sp. CC10]CAA7070323.1 Unannotated [Lentimonas sp. CC11]